MDDGWQHDGPARTRNRSANQPCHRCIDGLAEIGTRPLGTGHVPLYAPCPYCEQGATLEFPQGRARWPDGYWQGRPPDTVDPPNGGTLCGQLENLMRSRLLKARFAGRNVDPAVGWALPERERLAVLSEQMKALG